MTVEGGVLGWRWPFDHEVLSRRDSSTGPCSAAARSALGEQ
ncbi:hypothetical protein [Streptosporangium vulgare]